MSEPERVLTGHHFHGWEWVGGDVSCVLGLSLSEHETIRATAGHDRVSSSLWSVGGGGDI